MTTNLQVATLPRVARPLTERHVRVAFTATKDGPLRLAVLDLDHRGDTGALRVTLTRR